MNAPASKAAVGAEFLEIPIDSIVPSGTHVQAQRRKRYSIESLADLAASVAKLGVQQPGVVRKIAGEMYELVAGERRWRAARQANIDTFPAIVRDLDDASALEVQLVENIQREKLHPLEEAIGYDELMKVGKLTAVQVGDRVGMSRAWVYSRLDLLKLDDKIRAAFEKEQIDLSRALLLAGIKNPEHRERMFGIAMQKMGDSPLHSVRDLQEQMGRHRITVHLRAAPFDTGATLGTLPPCTLCPKRSGNMDHAAADPDVCTDPACFDTKVKLAADHRLALVKTASDNVLRGADAAKVVFGKKDLIGYVDLDSICEDDVYPEPEPDYSTVGGDEEAEQAAYDAWDEKSRAWQPRTYRKLLEGQQYTTTMIEMPGGRRAVSALPVKVARELLKSAGVKLSGEVGQKPAPKPKRHDYKAEQERHEAQQKKRAEEEKRVLAFRRKILAEVFPKATGPLTSDELHQVAEVFCDDWSARETLALVYGGKKPQIGNLKDAELHRAMRIVLFCDSAATAHRDAKPLLALAKRCKVDVAKIQKEFEAAEKAAATAKPKK